MPHVITAVDGRNHTVFDGRDILALVDEYIGYDARCAVEDLLSEQEDALTEADAAVKEYETENGRLRNHMRLVISDLYEEASWLRKLVDDPHPKRSELRECIQKIWDVLYQEI